jgi:ribose 5-phosphate isomerase A
MAYEADKRAAAAAALAEIADGMTIGLGSGSTAAELVRLLGARVRAGLRVRAVPTSSGTRALAEAEGIPLVDFDDAAELDVAIDGADQIDPQRRLIKGGGGALLYEKVVASAARRFVVIADGSKLVPHLDWPVPVEVVPFARPLIERRIRDLGGEPVWRQVDGRPYLTDAGHHILDCRLDLAHPEDVAARLRGLPGVVEHGLFLGMADRVVVAQEGRLSYLP